MTLILENTKEELFLPSSAQVNGKMSKSKNLLLQLEEFKIDHFITKSIITADFESGECRYEWHIFHKIHPKIGHWNIKVQEYPYIKQKQLSKSEQRWFRQNMDRYRIDKENEDGTIWVNKSVGFTKIQDEPVPEIVKTVDVKFEFIQLRLFEE